MVKVKVKYVNKEGIKYIRTFYTRRDWHNGSVLYMYYYRTRRMTGNWFNDPGYDYMAWDDYYEEYDRQQRGEREPDDPTEVKMKELVAKHNNVILDMIDDGAKMVSLNELEGE